MDETPVSFDLSSFYTLEKYGSNTISIKTKRHEKSMRVTYLNNRQDPSCIADDSKLLSVIIFKLKNKLKKEFSDGIFIRTNEKG